MDEEKNEVNTQNTTSNSQTNAQVDTNTQTNTNTQTTTAQATDTTSQDEAKYEKALKDSKIFSIIMIVLIIIIFAVNFAGGTLSTLQIIVVLFQLGLLVGNIVGCNQKMMYGPICGIIFSILEILSLTLIDILLGIAYLIDCVNIIKHMKNN